MRVFLFFTLHACRKLCSLRAFFFHLRIAYMQTGSVLIKKHKLTQLSDGIQKFYGSACFRVTLRDKANLDEVLKTLEEAYKQKS